MSNVESYADNLINFSKTIKTLGTELHNLTSNSFGWSLEQIAESLKSLFDRFCPHRVGDCVQLSHTLDIKENSGWYGSRHFLIKGSKGIVVDRGYRDDKFSFDIRFDDESWIDREGNKQPTINKHAFTLYENDLRLPCGSADGAELKL